MSASASDEPDSAAAGLSVLNSIEHAEDADCLTLIAGQLGADRTSIARLASANRFCRRTVTAASSVWRELCTALWADKLCVAPQAKALLAAGEARQALRFSLEDAKRTELTDEELLTLPWRFRFKAAAGEGWMHADPYWNDQPATRVRFEPSGNMVPTGFEELGHRTLRWQWGRSRDGARDGTRLQLHVDGHRVPTYLVSRHAPNWGWLMQSCWVLYTSFEMPPRGSEPSLDDAALGVTVETQSREARLYNTGAALGADLGGVGDEDEDEDEPGGGGGPTVVVQMADGQQVELPLWLLRNLVLAQQQQQGGEDEEEDEQEEDDEEEDEEDEEQEEQEEQEGREKVDEANERQAGELGQPEGEN